MKTNCNGYEKLPAIRAKPPPNRPPNGETQITYAVYRLCVLSLSQNVLVQMRNEAQRPLFCFCFVFHITYAICDISHLLYIAYAIYRTCYILHMQYIALVIYIYMQYLTFTKCMCNTSLLTLAWCLGSGYSERTINNAYAFLIYT